MIFVQVSLLEAIQELKPVGLALLQNSNALSGNTILQSNKKSYSILFCAMETLHNIKNVIVSAQSGIENKYEILTDNHLNWKCARRMEMLKPDSVKPNTVKF